MALTFSPDPPHLLAGAGTAAEQSARPQLKADYVNGGWSGGAQVINAQPQPGDPRHWYFYGEAVSDWDFGDGSTMASEKNGQRIFTADGTYEVTATGVDGRVGTVLVRVRSDQNTAPPSITTVAPTDVPAGSVSTVTLTGAGFGLGDRVELMGFEVGTFAQVFFEAPVVSASATELRFTFDPVAHNLAAGPNLVWVRKPDHTYTTSAQFNTTA